MKRVAETKEPLVSGVLGELWRRTLEFGRSVVSPENPPEDWAAPEMETELDDLRSNVEGINAVLADADRRNVGDATVLLWLRSLREVALDFEDVDDEVETVLRRNSGELPPGFSLFFWRRVGEEIAEIKARYKELARGRETLWLGTTMRPGGPAARLLRSPPPTAAVMPEEPLYVGRDGDRNEIVSLLLAGGDGLPVVPIWGMAGMGKTVLARLVLNDEEVKRHFEERRIWISAAAGGFDAERITAEILESLTGEPAASSNLCSFDLMQRKVRELLQGEPFLLVLDGVEAEGPRNWENLRLCLPAGGGGRVLVTTRMENVAVSMGTAARERLRGLAEEHCYRLLERRAFPENGLDRLPGLRKIGEQIAGKCQGSPLAAITIGGLLHGEEEREEWERVLREVEAFPQEEDDILPQLKLTYALLPLPLKKCFTFCGIFSEGHPIDKDLLVRLWMAQGFIQPRGAQRMERLGSQYFEKLLWISFFQASSKGKQGQAAPATYVIPGLFQKLVSSLRESECVRMLNLCRSPEPRSGLENTRHASLFMKSVEEEGARGAPDFTVLHDCRKLRTLSLAGGGGRIGKLPADLLPRLRFLRALDLNDSAVRELPDSVGVLSLLRFLGLRNTKIELLPESVAMLGNLQTLELSHCYELRMLPKGTSELTNLRHLGLHVDEPTRSTLQSTPPGIGRLRSLETLSRFIVGTEDGRGLPEMKDLKLRGELWISKLENVLHPEDAQQANLKNKGFLHSLTLEWSDPEENPKQRSDSVELIENLQPPSKLICLQIVNYNGATAPSWLHCGGGFRDLSLLRLSHCRRWTNLPELGRLPALKELLIEGIHGLTTVEHQAPASASSSSPSFPALEKLTLSDLPALETWAVSEGEMPRLRELSILSCPSLVDLPHLPSSLTKLKVRGCGALLIIPRPRLLKDIEIQ